MKRTPIKKFMRKKLPIRMNPMKKKPLKADASISGP